MVQNFWSSLKGLPFRSLFFYGLLLSFAIKMVRSDSITAVMVSFIVISVGMLVLLFLDMKNSKELEESKAYARALEASVHDLQKSVAKSVELTSSLQDKLDELNARTSSLESKFSLSNTRRGL